MNTLAKFYFVHLLNVCFAKEFALSSSWDMTFPFQMYAGLFTIFYTYKPKYVDLG